MRIKLSLFTVLLFLSCESAIKTTDVNTKKESKELQNKRYIERYENGQIKIQGDLVAGMRQGKWESFYENGIKWSESNYLNGQRNGIYMIFYRNGNPKIYGKYEKEAKVDVWFFYNENGKFEKEIDFNPEK